MSHLWRLFTVTRATYGEPCDRSSAGGEMVTAIVTEVSRLSAHRHDVDLAVLARATAVATTRPAPAPPSARTPPHLRAQANASPPVARPTR
jgi:hypothetical protein